MRLALVLALALPIALSYAFQSAAPDPLAEARKELFAARYTKAAELYSALLAKEPANPDAYYGIVRSLIGTNRAPEAYEYAEQALQRAPQKGSTEDAAGLASFRKGDLDQAETHFRTAMKLNVNDPAALRGIASIYSVVSKNKTARDLLLKAYSLSPDDPALKLAHADSLKGPEHVEALEELLASLEPSSDEARRLRFLIAVDRATLGHNLRRLTSPYESTQLKLFQILNGLPHERGVGLHVQLNHLVTLKLILDVSASGISIAPSAAKRAGLARLGREGIEVKGMGDQKPELASEYLASEVQIGNVALTDCPIFVFRGAETANYDGLIGMDLFRRFVVALDLPGLNLSLVARPEGPGEQEDLTDAGDVPAGFTRVMRFGSTLALPTSVNGHPPVIFAIRVGSNLNEIDSALGRHLSLFYRDPRANIRGAQGHVVPVDRARDMTLTFAGFRQSNVNLTGLDLKSVSDSAGVELAGSLGLPALDQMKLTIDYREGLIRIEYRH